MVKGEFPSQADPLKFAKTRISQKRKWHHQNKKNMYQVFCKISPHYVTFHFFTVCHHIEIKFRWEVVHIDIFFNLIEYWICHLGTDAQILPWNTIGTFVCFKILWKLCFTSKMQMIKQFFLLHACLNFESFWKTSRACLKIFKKSLSLPQCVVRVSTPVYLVIYWATLMLGIS